MYNRSALSLLAALLLTGALASCDRIQEARNQANAIKAATKAAASMGEAMADANKHLQERRQKGDTLAVPYQELEKYLPASIDGYQKDGDPQGSMMNSTGVSYSTCSQSYKTGSEDNPKTLKITIVDYNGAGAMYAGATAVLGSGFSMEDDQQRVQSTDLGVGHVKAMETYHKQDHRASVTAGVNERFFVSVEADQQDDTELVKRVAKEIDMGKLAAL